jgi:DNA primase
MSNISEWIKTELYPSLFESIDKAFPEHNFKPHLGGWRSKTYLTGDPHKDRIDKTIVTNKAPGIILEQGGEILSLVDYVIKRDRVEFITAVEILSKVVGLEIPKGDIGQEDYKKHKEQATLQEACNSYFIYCLENSKGAEEIRSYLNSRGYSSEDIKAMELGYIPNQEKLFNYLESKGYSQKLIDEVVSIKTDTRIGSTHNLTIPYRSGGSIKGFKFRIVGNNKIDTGHKAGGYKIVLKQPKYLNSKGLDKIGGFFNLLGIKGDKDLIIVEGELDSLSATVKGVNNVVSTGGDNINSQQVKDAILKGAKKFTICLDREPGKEKETAIKIHKAIDTILQEGVNRVYIVTLPENNGEKTDPDSLIRDKGVEAFIKAVAQAIPYYEFKLQEILNKYAEIEGDSGGLTSKQIDNLLDEVVETSSRIESPVDRDRFKSLFTSFEPIKDIGITEESLSITVDRLTSSRDREAQAQELGKLLKEATDLQSKGETSQALEILEGKVKEVKLKDKATEFSSLLLPIKEEEIKDRQANKPPSVKTGITIEGSELLLPSGAISIIALPTSHGKTTITINLALNVVEAYPDKEIYLFSFEEDKDSILMKTLNTYIDENELSSNNRRSIQTYFSTGSTEYIKTQARDYFTEKKDKFFKELIDTRRLNIHYTAYDSDSLNEAIRYLHKNANPGAVFIDYMQLLHKGQGGKNKYNSRQEELKQICLDLKDVAVETGLPIILGAQFNREVIDPTRLHATKIGEAGDIERIANLIVGGWNGNFKPLSGTAGELNEINSKGMCNDNTLFLKILKNRDGAVGLEQSLEFNGNTGKVKNSSTSSKGTDSPFK